MPVGRILGANVIKEGGRRGAVITDIVSSKIWFEFPGKNFESRTLSNTVCADQTKYLAWPWGGQTMKLKSICGVSMSYLRFKVRRQVDDGNRLEWTSEKLVKPPDHPSNTHFLTQIPHPMQRNSEMNAILSDGLTSMHNFPRVYKVEDNQARWKQHTLTHAYNGT